MVLRRRPTSPASASCGSAPPSTTPPAARSRSAPAPLDGPVSHRRGARHRRLADLCGPDGGRRRQHHDRAAVLHRPRPAVRTGRLFNVNWVDFIGRGVTDNAPPVVTATATPPTGTAPFTVAFTGTATDAEGDTPLTYAWDFGDGGTATTANASHTYTAPGTFTATLTVTDARGAKGYSQRGR